MYLLVTGEDLNLNCRVFLWPKDMEAVIELAIQRLNMKRDQAETILKNRKIQFDARLRKDEKLLNQFKKKDPPILTMEEMEEGVLAVESLVQRLAVRKNYAFCIFHFLSLCNAKNDLIIEIFHFM